MSGVNWMVRKVNTNSLRYVIACSFYCILLTLIWSPLRGQDSSVNDPQLVSAVKLLDRSDQLEREASEQAFRSAVKSDPKSQLAACALILTSVQAGDGSEALAGIENLPNRETLPEEFRVVIAKIQLCAAIAASNSSESETRFKELAIAAISEKTDIGVRREYTALLSKIIELLIADIENAPIKKETLTKAIELLSTSSNLSLAHIYQDARKDAQKNAHDIRKWSDKLTAISVEEKENTMKQMKNELEPLEERLSETVETAMRATAHQKEVHRSKVIGSKKLEANYRIVQSEPPAAGHPGFPPMPPPPGPPK